MTLQPPNNQLKMGLPAPDEAAKNKLKAIVPKGLSLNEAIQTSFFNSKPVKEQRENQYQKSFERARE